MILIDECVSHHLKEFLEANGLEERIICVSQEEGLRGKSDEFLTGYSIGAEFAFDKPSVLITRDYAFHNDFYGRKVMYSHSNWYGMFKYLKKVL